MSTPGGPIKLTLTSYVENHLTTILKAGSNEDFNTAFDNFFSEELREITFNGKKLSREAYKKQLGEAARADNTVSFPGIVTALKCPDWPVAVAEDCLTIVFSILLLNAVVTRGALFLGNEGGLLR